MAKNQVKRYTRSKGGTFVIALFLILFGAFTLLPMIYLLVTSLKPLEEIMAFPPKFYVVSPTFENFRVLPKLLSTEWVPFSRYMLNSIFVSVITTVLHVLVASAAAFVLSKYSKYKFFSVIFIIVQLSLLYNAYTLTIPQYVIMSKLKMLNTYWVYILPYLPSSLGIFLLKQYMDSSIPETLLEAAKIDGANCFKIYFRIALPLAKPAMLTLVLFAFKDMWQTSASNMIFDEDIKLLPNIIAQIAEGGITRQGSTMAATVVMLLFPIAVYLISQSSITKTMSSSGIKG
ncbi:MAG: carbohydrate ABC transporter permease [Clostridia bacterium]|nr:carbohydrate ABC transporter permease [Clostridia bacterium]